MKTNLLTILIICIMLTGCQPVATSTPAANAGSAFRAAILLLRAIEADGWTRSGYQGLLRI
jgi:uncharacterized protein YceK